MGVEDPGAQQTLPSSCPKDEGSDPHLDALLGAERRHLAEPDCKERVITMVEAKLSARSPDEMDVNYMSPNSYDEEGAEELQALGTGGVHCYTCGAQGHPAARCGTPEPSKERLDSREMAKAREKESEKERWIGTGSAATAARGATSPGTVGLSSEMTPEEKEVTEHVLRPWKTR